jgi:hypothetical protein
MRETQTLQVERSNSPPRLRKGKGQGLNCYGFLNDDGSFDSSTFAYGPVVYIYSKVSRFVNAKSEADWISVSTFTKQRKVKENISHVLCCFLDLDGPYTGETGEILPLTADLIRQRCFMLGLPMPCIIETSPGRFHVKFYFKRAIPISKESYILLVQRALHHAFKEFGPDPSVTEDLTRFLRNENQINSINKKHPDKPSVIVHEKGSLCTLSDLYHALKQHGFIQLKGLRPRRERQTSFYVSQGRLLRFLRANNGVVTK